MFSFSVFTVLCLGDSGPILVESARSFRLEQLDQGFQKTANFSGESGLEFIEIDKLIWLVHNLFLIYTELDMSRPVLGNSEKGFDVNNENDTRSGQRRKKRQVTTTNSIDVSVSQECEGIVLRWAKPNYPSR